MIGLKKKIEDLNTMDVISPSRGKGGRFIKKKGKTPSKSMSSPLLKLATVMIATIAVASSHSCRTPVELPRVQLVEIEPKKKRRRSDINLLGDENHATERYASVTLKYGGEHSIVAERCLTLGEPLKRVKKAMKASMASRCFVFDDDGDMFERTTARNRMEGEGLQASRRCAIAYFFEHIYGNPAESEWHGRGGVVAQVMLRLEIPTSSVNCVRKVFEDVAKAIK